MSSPRRRTARSPLAAAPREARPVRRHTQGSRWRGPAPQQGEPSRERGPSACSWYARERSRFRSSMRRALRLAPLRGRRRRRRSLPLPWCRFPHQRRRSSSATAHPPRPRAGSASRAATYLATAAGKSSITSTIWFVAPSTSPATRSVAYLNRLRNLGARRFDRGGGARPGQGALGSVIAELLLAATGGQPGRRWSRRGRTWAQPRL